MPIINNPLTIDSPVPCDTLSQCLLLIIDVVILFSVPIVTLAIVYCGFLFVTSGGNVEKIKKAKHILFWAIVGMLVLFGADVIASVVVDTVSALGET